MSVQKRTLLILCQSGSSHWVDCRGGVREAVAVPPGDLFSLWVSRSCVLCADVGSELFIALGFVRFLHFIERSTNERTGRLEQPLTLRAAEALKILVFNPDQLACHCSAPSPLRIVRRMGQL